MQNFPGFNPISAHSYIGVQPVKRRFLSPNDTVRAQLGAALPGLVLDSWHHHGPRRRIRPAPAGSGEARAATKRARGGKAGGDEVLSTAGDGEAGVCARAPRGVLRCHGHRAPRRLRPAGGQPPHPRLLRRRRPLAPSGARPGKIPPSASPRRVLNRSAA